MTLSDYANAVRENKYWVIIALLGGAVAGLALFFLRPPDYTAHTTLYVSAQATDSASSAFQGAQLSQQRVASYVELAQSTRISATVANEIGPNRPADQLVRQISAASESDSVLIKISAIDSDPVVAARIANGAGQAMVALVDELERPTSIGGVPAVAVRVVEPAEVPESPTSVGVAGLIAIGLLSGALLGLAIAIARSQLDSRIKRTTDLESIAGSPSLGSIAFDANTSKKPMALLDDPHAVRSEAYRQIRTNLQYLDVDRENRVVLITSSLAGEGKSTTAANIAHAAAAGGARVLLVEADLRRPRASQILGIDRTVGLSGVLTGRVRVEGAVQRWSAGGFDVLASGPLPPNPGELLGSQSMRALLDELRRRYSLVILDGPPLLPVADASALVPATDGAVVVCRHRSTKSDDLTKACDMVRRVSGQVLGVIFNMTPPSTGSRYAGYEGAYKAGPDVAQMKVPAGE